MKKTIGILGLGIFGSAIAKTLADFDCDVIAVDQAEDKVNDVEPYITKGVVGDITDRDLLAEIGIGDCDIVIIATGTSLEASVLAIMHCKQLGIPEIIAKSKGRTTSEIFQQMGATRAINPEKETGIRLAKNILYRKITEVLSLDDNTNLIEFSAPSSWLGKTLIDLDVRNKYHLNIIGYRKSKSEPLNTQIDGSFQISDSQILVALADARDFDHSHFLTELRKEED